MQEEYLDILNEKGEKTGEVKTYNEAHQKGLTHRSVHIWFINSKKEILIQKRAENRRAFGGYWDISVSGHISSGENSIEASLKETKEEIGILLKPEDYLYLGELEENISINENTFINNEFQDIYIVKKDIKISEMKTEKEEVEEMRWLTLEEFGKWVNDEGEKMVPHDEEYKMIINYVKNLK